MRGGGLGLCKYYLHVLIDNYSRRPRVQVVKNTSFKVLGPVFDQSFSLLGVPASTTHGPPNQSTA